MSAAAHRSSVHASRSLPSSGLSPATSSFLTAYQSESVVSTVSLNFPTAESLWEFVRVNAQGQACWRGTPHTPTHTYPPSSYPRRSTTGQYEGAKRAGHCPPPRHLTYHCSDKVHSPPTKSAVPASMLKGLTQTWLVSFDSSAASLKGPRANRLRRPCICRSALNSLGCPLS